MPESRQEVMVSVRLGPNATENDIAKVKIDADKSRWILVLQSDRLLMFGSSGSSSDEFLQHLQDNCHRCVENYCADFVSEPLE